MISYIFDLINLIGIFSLLPLSIIEIKYFKNCIFFNKLLKNQIINSGPIPIKIAQFVINFQNLELKLNKPYYLIIYDELFDNVYKNNINNIEDYTLVNSGSICGVYLHSNNKEILKKLHYKSRQSTTFYFAIIKCIFYIFNIPISVNDFSKIFLNQFSMNFESEMQQNFYNSLDNKLIQIPRVIKYNDEEILMEYLPSKSYIKSNLSIIKTIKYCNMMAIFFKHMYLEKGIIHLDIHDGNWGINEKGIVIYDFGYSLTLFDPMNETERKIYTDLIFYFLTKDMKNLINVIFTHFINPPIINNNFILEILTPELCLDDQRLLSEIIEKSKIYKYKIHINLYYILHSFIVLKFMYNHLFYTDPDSIKDKSSIYLTHRINKIIHENAIIHTNPYYNNVKLLNNRIIDYLKKKE
jgi:hypothetical protein